MHNINLMRHAVSAALLISLFAGNLHATVFTVDTTSDSIANTGSLRYAITNLAAGSNTIQFDIPTSDPGYNATTMTWTIQPATDLPNIAEQVTINGYSFIGAVYNTNATPNTLSQGDNAKLSIIINGSNYMVGDGITTGNGLHFAAGSGGSIVQGLVINQWIDNGILVDGTGALINGIQIIGNFIGTDSTGTIQMANRCGIGLSGSVHPITNTRIGTPSAADRNIIGGSFGISDDNYDLVGTSICSVANSGTLIQNNYIGTDVTGTISLGNGLIGILLIAELGGTVGGTTRIMGNLISGYTLYGAFLSGSGACILQNNYIGTDITGINALGNLNAGIHLDNNFTNSGATTGSLIIDNLISGNGAGVIVGDNLIPGSTLNTIQNNKIGTDYSGTKALANTRFGVIVLDSQNTVTGNVISGNMAGGILIYNILGTATTVTDNLIGTDFTGLKLLPNIGNGIQIGLDSNLSAPTNNIIGM